MYSFIKNCIVNRKMNSLEDDTVLTHGDAKKECYYLPPKVIGKVSGFLTLKVDRIVWWTRSHKHVVVSVVWWGENEPHLFRPCIIGENMLNKIESEITYEVRTDMKTFEYYLQDCESLELYVVDEETKVAIGKVIVPNLSSVISENSFGGYFSIIDSMGIKVGDVYVGFHLFLLLNTVNKTVKPQSSSSNSTSKLFVKASTNNVNVQSEDSENDNAGIQIGTGKKMKDAAHLDYIDDAMQLNAAAKHANCVRISILSLSLNSSGLKSLVQQVNCRNAKKKHNSLHHSSLLSRTTYFVEYELPATQKTTGKKIHNSRKSCPWNRRVIRFCSRKQVGSDIYFSQSSVHLLPGIKSYWQQNFEDLKIMVKVFSRNLNQQIPLQIGETTLEIFNVIKSETLSFSSDAPVLSLAQVPHQVHIGMLRIKVELGKDYRYFGKELIKMVFDDSHTEDKGLTLPQEDEKVLVEDSYSNFSENELQDHNKETLPETEMKHHYREKTQAILLFGLLYISGGQGFNIMNSYVVSKSLWKEDIIVSNIFWGSSSPNYNLHELIPVFLCSEFLERCQNNFLIAEVWERKPVAQCDTLIGIAKLPLNQFFVAYRNPQIAEQLVLAKYPVVAVDGWVNVFNPVNRLQAGQLHVILCLGTEDQIHLFETTRGLKETCWRPIRTQSSNSMHHAFSSIAVNNDKNIRVSVTKSELSTDNQHIITHSRSTAKDDDELSFRVLGSRTHSAEKETPQKKMETNEPSGENINTNKSMCDQIVRKSSKALEPKQQHDTSMHQYIDTKPRDVQQNKSIQPLNAHKLAANPNTIYNGNQISEHEHSIENYSNINESKAIYTSTAENLRANEVERNNQHFIKDSNVLGSSHDNNGIISGVKEIEAANNASAELMCSVRDQESQTDLFVLDLQHYDTDFLSKHSKNIEPLVIKVSGNGLEIIQTNENNSNIKIPETKKVAELQLTENVTSDSIPCKLQDHHSDHAGETTYEFNVSGDKECKLSSVDHHNNHKKGEGTQCKLSTGDHSIPEETKKEVDVGNVVNCECERKEEEEHCKCSSNCTSMKQRAIQQFATVKGQSLASNTITDSKENDYHIVGITAENAIGTKQNYFDNADNNYYSLPECQPKDKKEHSLGYCANEGISFSIPNTNNVITGKRHKLNDYCENSVVAEQSYSFNHVDSLSAPSNASHNTKYETDFASDKTDQPTGKEQGSSFEKVKVNAKIFSKTNVSNKMPNASLARYNEHTALEYIGISSDDHFCVHLEIAEAIHLELQKPNETGGNVYVSFQLNQGCAKVVTDGEVELKTGLLYTSFVPYNGNPVWNWHCEAWLPSELLTSASSQFILKIWHKNCASDTADPSTGTILGFAAIDLTVLLLGMPWVCGWFNILNFTGCGIGQIKVSLKPLENLARFKSGTLRVQSDYVVSNDSFNSIPVLENTKYPQDAGSSTKGKEHCSHYLFKRPVDRKIQFNKHTSSKVSAVPDTVTLTKEKGIFMERDLDFSDGAHSLLAQALKQKLSELDEITQRLKRRLHSVTTENTLPQCSLWEQNDVDSIQDKKNDQKSSSRANTEICAQQHKETKDKVQLIKINDAACSLFHKSPCCKELFAVSQFENDIHVSKCMCKLKHSDHLNDEFVSSRASTVSDAEISCDELQNNIFEHSCANSCHQYCKSHKTAEVENGNMKESFISNTLERNENYMNQANDMEDFDALTDFLMQSARKELDIDNIFNPLLFQHLLVINSNFIQRRCQKVQHCNKGKVHNLLDHENNSEIMLKYVENSPNLCSTKEIDRKNTVVQVDVSSNSQNKNIHYYIEPSSFHNTVKMNKCEKVGKHACLQKQLACQDKIANKEHLNYAAKVTEPLASPMEVSSVTQSSLGILAQNTSNLEKECKIQHCHQLKISGSVEPLKQQTSVLKLSPIDENEIQERYSKCKVNEKRIELEKTVQNCLESTEISKQKKGNIDELVQNNALSRYIVKGDCNEELPSELRNQQKQMPRKSRLAPSCFQKPSIGNG